MGEEYTIFLITANASSDQLFSTKLDRCVRHRTRAILEWILQAPGIFLRIKNVFAFRPIYI